MPDLVLRASKASTAFGECHYFYFTHQVIFIIASVRGLACETSLSASA
jgi:hypothetical protein